MGFIPGTQDWFKSLDEIQPGNRKKHKNHRDISEMEKRYLKNSMNIHDKILKKKKKKPQTNLGVGQNFLSLTKDI